MSASPAAAASGGPAATRAYVATMMAVIGRSLVAMSQVDDVVRREFSALPVGYTIRMTVMGDGPAFAVEVREDGVLRLLDDASARCDLNAVFKHNRHAFLVFSFQEGTARAFANDRLYVDGNLSHAIRLVRCLNRMEAIILPKVVAERAIKRYPHIRIGEKLSLATRTYGRLVANLFRG